MYISQLFVKNFRSLKEVQINFRPGRNVLVGKNNSGKSNIVKCLDILLGEKFPTYITFSDNDFHTYLHEDREFVSEYFFMEATLEGDGLDESILRTQKKKFAFSRLQSIDRVYSQNDGGGIEINTDLLLNLDEIETKRSDIDVLEIYSSGRERLTDWKDKNQLIQFLKEAKQIKIFLIRSRDDDQSSSHGLIVKDNSNQYWISHYLNKKVRESLITTAIIGALRSPKEELRLVHYTWFGKFMKRIWDANKGNTCERESKSYDELIFGKTNEIREYGDEVFQKSTEELTKLLNKAIFHNNVSFKFFYDDKSDFYKNLNIYVDDGLDRPLEEKGTGIQSALIIALFSQYCNQFHSTSSLLITEEPEVFLHPQARRVLCSELDKFLETSDNQQRQLIISTHSPEFLKNVGPQNIIRVDKRRESNETVSTQLRDEVAEELDIDFQRLLWSGQTEIFFADKVVLVEGGELYLLPVLVDALKGEKQLLDYRNISVSRINGKGNFLKYIKMLDSFGIKWVLLGDLDCYKDEVLQLSRYLGMPEIEEGVVQISTAFRGTLTDYKKLKQKLKKPERSLDVQVLHNLLQKLSDRKITADDEDLQSTIEYINSRYARKESYPEILEELGLKEVFQNVQTHLRSKNIFIWNLGELEDYYTDEVLKISGSKDVKALLLSYKINADPDTLPTYLKAIDEIEELVGTIIG